jgi:prefoldin subunit 5
LRQNATIAAVAPAITQAYEEAVKVLRTHREKKYEAIKKAQEEIQKLPKGGK